MRRKKCTEKCHFGSVLCLHIHTCAQTVDPHQSVFTANENVSIYIIHPQLPALDFTSDAAAVTCVRVLKRKGQMICSALLMQGVIMCTLVQSHRFEQSRNALTSPSKNCPSETMHTQLRNGLTSS